MARRTFPINLVDFTGGLNLRANETSLAENESPDMLNVEVDPRGGVSSRRGWLRWNGSPIVGGAWDPRNSYVHELASGVDLVAVVNSDGNVYESTDGSFSEAQLTGAQSFAADASPHRADFASWGDELFVVRGSLVTVSREGASGLFGVRSDPATAGWADDYAVPSTGRCPRASYVASHSGRLWVADTVENGVRFPYRVRWSHPNAPGAWASTDYIDLLEGGGPITAIIPLDDHLLVFKASSVWAIYGYDSESHQVLNVSHTVGALNRQVVARSEDAVYSVSWPEGVFRVSSGEIAEISEALRPAFSADTFNRSAVDNMWLGWLDKRLWWAVPYHDEDVPTDAASVFVWDPTLPAWTMFRGATGHGLGPFAQSRGQSSFASYGFDRGSANVVELDSSGTANDNIEGSIVPFATRYTTRWLNGGWPDLRKRWVRPTFLAHERELAYRLQVSVFTNYEEGQARRKFGLSVSPRSSSVVYDDGTLYDDGAVYGTAAEGALLRRANPLGSAASVQLQIDGEPGNAWGLDSLVMKYKPRRFR